MKNVPIEFSGIPAGSHKCTSEVQGDWVVFRCEHCQDYERRINLKTKTVVITGKNEFTHYGIGGSLAIASQIITPN